MPTIVNGLVKNAVTGEPMSGIEVRLIEDIAGFPFSAATTVETAITDASGNFQFVRTTKKALGVAISPNNEFISTAVTYPQIVTFKTDLVLGQVNNVLLTPAEIGFLTTEFYGDSGSDSLLSRIIDLPLTPPNYNYNFWIYYSGVEDIAADYDQIIGKYVFENKKYLNGNETHWFDTVEVFKGQTTVYELHF